MAMTRLVLRDSCRRVHAQQKHGSHFVLCDSWRRVHVQHHSLTLAITGLFQMIEERTPCGGGRYQWLIASLCRALQQGSHL